MDQPTNEQLSQMANKLRAHSLRMTTQAGSGHPSSCCSMAEIMSVLFFDQMEFDPKDPQAKNGDQFVMSKGHAAPILWAALSEAGGLEEDLLTLRQFSSTLEGHPTPRNPWVRVATGSLGQGLSAACGIALAHRFEDIHQQVFVAMGDGEVAEGAVWEAAQFAGHHRLNHLCAIIDLNRLGQSGVSYFQHDADGLAKRWDSFGWQAIVVDGHDVPSLRRAFTEARANEDKPTVLIARTSKGRGVLLFEDKGGWHGKPLPKDKLDDTIMALGDIDLTLPVARRTVKGSGNDAPKAELEKLAPLRYEKGAKIATREAYGSGLVRLASCVPNLVALDGDTKNSTFSERLLEQNPARFVECFIAEQNMVGVSMGLASMGWIPCASTFAAFLARAYDFIRMGIISRLPNLVLCGSHAGVSIGEDGPSQMALEDLAMMRGLIGTCVLYPSDAVSTERLMEAMVQGEGVHYLRTSRPKTPVIYNNDETFPIGGSKTVRSSAKDCCTLVAAGVTVHEAMTAGATLAQQGTAVRIIDAYSIKPIDAKTLQQAAKETGRMITVEDHSIDGGLGSAVCEVVTGLAPVTRLGIQEIPRSGSPTELMATYGIDASSIVKAVQAK
jgi:transketolase